MHTLEVFVENLCGEFNNDEQIKLQAKDNNVTHPKACHINGICNKKIKHLPKNFKGYFVIEESYYELRGRKNTSPSLLLITLNKDQKVILEPYEIPREISPENFTNNNENLIIDYNKLKKSSKFSPIIYDEKDGVFTGESISIFSPVTKFIFRKTIENNMLYVSGVLYKHNKKTFGFEEPIIYKRAGNF